MGMGVETIPDHAQPFIWHREGGMQENTLCPPDGIDESQYDRVERPCRARDRVEYALVLPLIALIRLLPESVATLLGKYAALMAYYLVPRRRKLGETNLAIAFPELSERERRRIPVN